jgi:hypothetical protein
MWLRLTDCGWRIKYVRLLLRESSLAIAVDGLSSTEKRAPAHALGGPIVCCPRMHTKA